MRGRGKPRGATGCHPAQKKEEESEIGQDHPAHDGDDGTYRPYPSLSKTKSYPQARGRGPSQESDGPEQTGLSDHGKVSLIKIMPP